MCVSQAPSPPKGGLPTGAPRCLPDLKPPRIYMIDSSSIPVRPVCCCSGPTCCRATRSLQERRPGQALSPLLDSLIENQKILEKRHRL